MYVCMYIPGVFVFETTKTKNPKFTAEFDLNSVERIGQKITVII